MSDLWITLGPSSLEQLDELFAIGVDGVRLTFSFGTPEMQLERARLVKRAAAAAGRPCTVVADLPGEKIRLGRFTGPESVEVLTGDEIGIICGEVADFDQERILPIPNASFVSGLCEGSMLVIGDGAAVLEVVEVGADRIRTVTVVGGTINQTRGVSIQEGKFEAASMTEEDRRNLAFIGQHSEFDVVALSFVSSAHDIQSARDILSDGGRNMPIIAKIESGAGLSCLDEIAESADMLMAARGDLALTLAWVELPAAVARIAEASAKHGCPWVLATQVAEGLERFAFMTRAEVCDLAHWLQQGCMAVMLSYETVFGRNARGAVECTKSVIDRWSTEVGLEGGLLNK